VQKQNSGIRNQNLEDKELNLEEEQKTEA